MADQQRFDLLILGGGMSYVGAIRAAQLGLSVGLIERDRLGGTCLNRGCIPSKALLETADLLHRVTEQGAEFGLAGHEGVSLDYGPLAKRRDAVIEKHVSGVEFLMKKNKVTVIKGNGVLTGPTSVRVSGGESGDVEATGEHLILATGSAPRSLPGLEPDGRLIITSDEALARGDVPGRVTIVGAGAIGVEWASMYRDFGAEVTLIEFADRIVPLEDPDISKELSRVFRKRGITTHVASTIDPETLKKGDAEVSFQVATRDGAKRTDLVADVILVAVGRRPLTEGIGLEALEGVEVDRGYVKVDEYMRTGAPKMYAIGDIVPGFALAHVASHEAVVAVEHLAGHHPEPVRMELMPRVTVCRPQREDRAVPVPRARQGHDRRGGRRLREVRRRCGDRRPSRLPHHRPARGRPDRRADARPAGGGDRRGGGDERPRSPDPARGAPRGRARGRRSADPRLRRH